MTAPLLPSPVLAEIALERYDAALAGGPAAPALTVRADAQLQGDFKGFRRFVTKCCPR